MNPAFGVLLIASVIAVNAFVIVDSYQTQMNSLDNQFNNQMNQTMGFLNNAWSIAQEFQNSSYTYNPSQLGNYTALGPTLANSTS